MPAIGRLHHVVLDCPEPRRSADFWSALLGLPVTYDSGEFAVVSADGTMSGLAFQQAPDHQPPTWPDPQVPQQMHLDVMVDDPATAGARAVALGARVLSGEDGVTGPVFADPAGHPFCLVLRPGWARPVSED